MLHLDRLHRAAIVQIIATRHVGTAFLFGDVTASDETPMLTGDTRNFQKSCQPARALADETRGTVVPTGGAGVHTQLGALFNAPVIKGARRKATAKLLQSDIEYFSVFGVGDTVFTFYGDVSTWVQKIDRNTGECYQEAELQRNTLPTYVALFDKRIRIANLDRHGANTRGERAVLAGRPEDWFWLHSTCKVHVQAGNFKHMFESPDIEQVVSGQINFALSVNFGTHFERWQACVYRSALRRVTIKRGRPAPNHSEYKRALLRLCLSRGRGRMKKLLYLHTLPNGNGRRGRHCQNTVPNIFHRVAYFLPVAARTNSVRRPRARGRSCVVRAIYRVCARVRACACGHARACVRGCVCVHARASRLDGAPTNLRSLGQSDSTHCGVTLSFSHLTAIGSLRVSKCSCHRGSC